MFQSARLKLTAWYLLIIMLVSSLFSVAFYHASTREIQQVIDRIRYMQAQRGGVLIFRTPTTVITLQELQAIKSRLKITLLAINGIIFVLAGGAGYFLAGRTLRPIKRMVDEQNQFISNASHELRTPISTLRAEMEGSLLEKHVSDKEARKLITSNLEELSKLQNLADNLLQLAHVHGNGSQQEISLQKVIQAALKKVTPMAKKKHIMFSLARVGGNVKGEKQRLIEVFSNLFENAIKYSPEKTTVTITSKTQQNTIKVTIADEGIGITANDLPHIFERFYRADKSRSKADGYGLGLSIVRRIVKAHNGTIEVKSDLGKGTKFTLTFPRVG